MTSKEESKEPMAGMGRYDLIDHISEKLGVRQSETAFSTATVAGNDGFLVSQNVMLEGIDFSLVYSPLKHLGYKCVTRAVAGIYASGGTPAALSVTVAMSARFGVAQAEELFEGIVTGAKRYGAEIRYFDFVSSVTGMTISCTAWGGCEGSVKFAAAPEVNDIICVTGDVGAAYLGLQVLERERRIFESGATVQPDLSDFRYVIGRQLRPDLKTDRLKELYKNGLTPSVMTVIREGLASELLGLCRGKEVGCRLYYDRIPVDSDTSRNAEEMNIDPVVAALNGGEDYEFMFFAPLVQADILSRQDGISMIGYITDRLEGCNLVTPDDHMVELQAQGWNKP